MEKKFFKIKYLERGEKREKYMMLDEKPEPKKTVLSLLATEISNPKIDGIGGIYGGTNCPYGITLSEDAEVEEVTPEEFFNAVIVSLHKNYVDKKKLKDLAKNILDTQ